MKVFGTHNVTTLGGDLISLYMYSTLTNATTAHVDRCNVLKNEPQTQTHNVIQNITMLNRISTSSNAFHGHDIDVSATCNRCDDDNNEVARYNMCYCSINRTQETEEIIQLENDCFTFRMFCIEDTTLIDC